MELRTSIKSDFLDLFYHDLENFRLDRGNMLNLFTLKIKNNKFAYDELVEILGESLIHFALSRDTVISLENENKHRKLVNLSIDKLRKYSVNDGELGELLLYCLLESHLNAPKILTKLEIKTAKNNYVHGADGVHLLKISEEDYQLVFGESKLDANLRQGIYDSFDSISSMLDNDSEKLKFEIELVNSQLIKECVDEKLYQFIKQLIMPTKNISNHNLDSSFGIFLGFNIIVSDHEKELSNSEFRKIIRERIINEVKNNIESFNYQINKKEFTGYDFYIYLIPFTEITTKRQEIIKDLINE